MQKEKIKVIKNDQEITNQNNLNIPNNPNNLNNADVIPQLQNSIVKKLKGYKTLDMVDCFICNLSIKKSNKTGICLECKYDNKKTITASDVKKKYGLNDEDLNSEILNYFYIGCKKKNGKGRKFFVNEIEKYTKNIIDDINSIEKHTTDLPDLSKENIELIKKKKKIIKKMIMQEKTEEIKKFFSKHIKNKKHIEILEIQKEYIQSVSLKLEDVKDKLIEKDKNITNVTNNKKEYFENLTELVRNKLESDYVNKFVKYLDEKINSQKTLGWLKIMSKKLKKHILITYANTFNNAMITKETILKSGIVEKIVKDICFIVFKRANKYIKK